MNSSSSGRFNRIPRAKAIHNSKSHNRHKTSPQSIHLVSIKESLHNTNYSVPYFVFVNTQNLKLPLMKPLTTVLSITNEYFCKLIRFQDKIIHLAHCFFVTNYVLSASIYIYFCIYSFNRIDVPPYKSYEKFFSKLTFAVEETCGFAME